MYLRSTLKQTLEELVPLQRIGRYQDEHFSYFCGGDHSCLIKSLVLAMLLSSKSDDFHRQAHPMFPKGPAPGPEPELALIEPTSQSTIMG